ncbi:uncharacterized protein LOC108667753 [Hyalella azteca]|uniref:Uncharacterized protein LOC108667753 n=1 Tax=Hyalella azteca TaxID=294128 RepID=A0A8B7N8R7_HYAAZ|nr:uncharacterized protein LOC108667753 [Hyalella azteca]
MALMKNTTGAVLLILSYVVYGVAARNPPNDNVGLCSCHEAACVPLSQCPRLQSLAKSRDIEYTICEKTGASKKYCCLPSNVCSKLDHRISENQVSTVGNDAKTVAANALPITEETNVWVKTTEENDGVFAVENYSDADTTKLNAGAFSTEPNVRAYSTEPNVRAYSTEPNVRAYSTEPNVRAHSPEPNVRAHSPEPNVRAYSTEPNVRAFVY